MDEDDLPPERFPKPLQFYLQEFLSLHEFENNIDELWLKHDR